MHRSNFVSRLNHSCDPNCRSITVVAGGRLTLGVWTTRPVAAGEELTLDFAGETEIEREAQLAVCLCGAASCRQSFLYLAPGPNSPLRSVLTKEYTFLDRMRRLVEVITHPELTAEDQQRLTRHGFKELILHDGLLPEATQVPQWLRKWVSDALAFVEHEEMELRKLLLGPRRVPLDDLEEGAVEEEIKHMASNRVHSLAVAVDRAKLFLRHQPEALKSQPPLRVLRDDEVVQYLWSGDDSVATR